jgi:hypothetical protein
MKHNSFELKILFIFDWRLVAAISLLMLTLSLRHLLG